MFSKKYFSSLMENFRKFSKKIFPEIATSYRCQMEGNYGRVRFNVLSVRVYRVHGVSLGLARVWVMVRSG